MQKRQTNRTNLYKWMFVPVATFLVLAGYLFYRQCLNALLFTAIKRNDSAAVHALLRQGADVNARDYSDDRFRLSDFFAAWVDGKSHAYIAPTPIIVALDAQREGPIEFHCLPENTDLIQALLDHGANINATDPGGDTPLQISANRGIFAKVRLLLKFGGSRITQNDRNKALVVAIGLWRPKVAIYLLDNGANANSYGNDCWSCLMLATDTDQQSVVESLLHHGADIDYATPSKETALSIALRYKEDKIEQVLRSAARGKLPSVSH